jgi:predicted dehydrogenase
MMKNRKLRIGIIGCGEIAVQHAKGVNGAKNAEIGMAMDVVPDLAKDLGEKYNVSHTTDIDALLNQKGIDAVYIATPHHLHAPLTIKAARAGKHVMVEKPMAVNLTQAEEMMDECRKAGVALSVCFVLRYLASTIKARELIQRGAIGKVIAIETLDMAEKPASYWQGGYTGRAKSDWRTFKEKSGGGILIMNISHNIDTMRYITGLEAKRVYSEYNTFATPVEVEDMIVCTLRYDNGAIGCIEASSCAQGRGSAADRIYGSEGQIVLGTPLKVYTTREMEGLKPNQWNEITLEQTYDLRTKYVEEFAEAVLSGKEPPITGKDGYAALKVVVTAYKSGQTHTPISL